VRLTADLVPASRFDFRILGPLEVYRAGEPIPLGGPRQRAALALLLLNANRVVSRQRLARDLQYEQPDADHAVRIQVSRLRKCLGEGAGADSRLLTRAPGYLLRVEDGELDLDRFVTLLSAGREAIARGEAQQGVSALRDADSLWRGRPLADLAQSPVGFEANHLEELRLEAVEERLEAELSLGHHAKVVAELETLVASYPLREGLRCQLMLALYRCGRQAEALEVYRAGRALLDEELGLQPGARLKQLEQAILRHDQELEAAPDAAPEPGAASMVETAQRRRWRRWPAVAVVALLAAVAAIVTVATVTRGGRGLAPPIRGNAVALVSAATGRPVGATPLDAAPTRVAVGLRSVWVSHLDAGTVSRIDRATDTVRQTIRVGRGPTGVAVASGNVWVANSLDGTVSRIDPATNTVVQTIAVGSQPSAAVAVGHSVWIVDRGDDNLLQLDALTGGVRRIVETGSGPIDASAARGTIWVANEGDGTVTRLDAGTGQVVDTIHVGDAPSAIAASATSVWLADELDATVSRLDPRTDAVTTTIPVGGRPAGIAVVGGTVLVSDLESGRLLRVDARRGAVTPIRQVGERAGPIADVGGRAWVGVLAGGADHHGGTLRIVSAGSPVSLDPALEDELTPLQLLGLTNDGLVTLDHAGGPRGTQLVPDLASSLPLAADGGRTYTFRLRHGIRYSSGGTVTASDVRSSFERLFELRSPGRSLYEKIRGARACLSSTACDLSRGIVVAGADAVTFHLTAPDPDFLYKLTEPYAFVLPSSAPRHARRSPLPATGPLMIASFEPGRELRLVRNPAFREWSAAAQPAAYPDSITWRLSLSPRSAVKLVERGQADLAQNVGALSKRQWTELRTRFASRLRTNPVMGTNFYFLNTRAKPFDQVEVRRALNFALDRRRMVAFRGGPTLALPTCQILPPQMPGYDRYCPYTRGARDDGRWNGPDLERARRLVEASGTKGMTVKVWDTPGPGGRAPAAQYLTNVLLRLGYRASLHLLPDAAFLRYTDDSRHHAQVISGGWGADYPSPSAMIGKLSCAGFIPNSSRTFDDSEFCDPRVDLQISRAESLGSTNHREATVAWRRLDRELTDRAIWLPTITSKQTDVISSRVGNYQYNPFWGALVDQLWVR
jgi:YVTN family beta-propeller protein